MSASPKNHSGSKRILMLVATSVASDTRVLREATTLAADGHQVHIIGKQVPTDWQPTGGITVSSVGAASIFRHDGAPSLAGKQLSPPMRMARWALLPTHRNSAFSRWAAGVLEEGTQRDYDVVHAHDFTALLVGSQLAKHRAVPLIYDTHELWAGRPRVGRPTPVQSRREAGVERELGSSAAAVITVGDGVARELHRRYGWSHIQVVRNTFPALTDAERSALPAAPVAPVALLYAGRLAPYRELEVIARASDQLDLSVEAVGPADETWLARFDRHRITIHPTMSMTQVDAALTSAGLALVTHSDKWSNHRLAMPNKLFHALRVGVPVVATDVGELGALVRQHGVGELYLPGDATDLVAAVARAVAGYDGLRAAVKDAATELSWDTDAQRLREVYASLPT